MRHRPVGPVFVSLLAAVSACVPADRDTTAGEPASTQEQADATQADVQAIDSLRIWFAESMTSGNVDGVMSNYAADAVQMPPNESALIGKVAIRARHQATQDQYAVSLENPSDEIVVLGDVGILRGSYVISLEPRQDGPVIRDNGKYIVTWLRQGDGSWLAKHEIWNSDRPLPEAPLAQ